jgi:hypothetical protein
MSQGAGRRVADDRSRSGARSWVESVGRVLRQPRLRRVLPAMLVSAVGDGMSMVAVAWLAVQIAPPDPVDVHAGGSRGGPALAGGLATLVGPGWVIDADAVSFAVLAVSSTSQNAPSIRIALTSCASSGSRRAPNSCCSRSPTA